MTHTEHRRRELQLLAELRQLQIDNNILRRQRDEWKQAAKEAREGR